MSWSVRFMGRPEMVAEALEVEATKLSVDSRREYERALPHITALVRQTFASEEGKKAGFVEPLVKITAAGSASSCDGRMLHSQVAVNIELDWTKLV